MTDRCEPPTGLRGVDGWHWIDIQDPEPVVIRWIYDCDDPDGGFWWHQRTDRSPSKMAEFGYRYIAPVAPPDAVAALVRAARHAASVTDLPSLSAALAAFKEVPDGE